MGAAGSPSQILAWPHIPGAAWFPQRGPSARSQCKQRGPNASNKLTARTLHAWEDLSRPGLPEDQKSGPLGDRQWPARCIPASLAQAGSTTVTLNCQNTQAQRTPVHGLIARDRYE
jgi:hypothetical protein